MLFNEYGNLPFATRDLVDDVIDEAVQKVLANLAPLKPSIVELRAVEQECISTITCAFSEDRLIKQMRQRKAEREAKHE